MLLSTQLSAGVRKLPVLKFLDNSKNGHCYDQVLTLLLKLTALLKLCGMLLLTVTSFLLLALLVMFCTERKRLTAASNILCVLIMLLKINPFSVWCPLKGHTLKQSCSFQLQVCLSMCDPLVDTQALKG